MKHATEYHTFETPNRRDYINHLLFERMRTIENKRRRS